MKKIVSVPNMAILLACLAWLIAFFGASFAIGDPRPADPNSPADIARLEKQIQEKDIVVKTAMVLSVILAVSPYILAFRRWRTARIRFSLALLICTSYLGSAVYFIMTT